MSGYPASDRQRYTFTWNIRYENIGSDIGFSIKQQQYGYRKIKGGADHRRSIGKPRIQSDLSRSILLQ